MRLGFSMLISWRQAKSLTVYPRVFTERIRIYTQIWTEAKKFSLGFVVLTDRNSQFEC